MHGALLDWHIDRPHRSAALGDLTLESGDTIRDFTQSYVTHGALDSSRSNAVLVCSAITGNHHRLDFLIGSRRAIDPARWFVIAADPIGNGLTTSPSCSALQPRMHFPRFSIRDMVTAQARLLQEVLGVQCLAAVIGASMGGMQALQWAVDAPLPLQSVVAMTAPAWASPWSVAVNEAARSCLMADPSWNGSEFTTYPARGWRAWFHVQRVLASRSPASVESATAATREVAEALSCWHSKWENRCDAHDFLYQSWAYDRHDVRRTRHGGFDPDALRHSRARALVMAPALDLYNPSPGVREVAAAMSNARFVEIPSIHGHQCTSGVDPADVNFLNSSIAEFLGA
jgi:homoserine O-acetyltransferase/O-succinyltransferase